MKIGLYQHGSTPADGVAEALAERDQKVAFRNALYFNGNELEKFETVVVDEGKNSDAIREAYEADGVTVLALARFLDGEAGSVSSNSTEEAVSDTDGSSKADVTEAGEAGAEPAAKPKGKKKATFDPDAKPKGKKPKKQG